MRWKDVSKLNVKRSGTDRNPNTTDSLVFMERMTTVVGKLEARPRCRLSGELIPSLTITSVIRYLQYYTKKYYFS